MGYGSYTASDWAKLKKSRGISSTSNVNELFKEKTINPKFNPKYIEKREAKDSDDHPLSTPIMIGVDVTGSMGYLSTQIIKESLNDLMQHMYASDYIKDPQILFAAIGDAVCDFAPLQVTQFESDIRIAEQLLGLWLENNGGDPQEDYELLWYFADKKTDLDCFNKRNEKGFCFTIGDEGCHESLSAKSINRIFDDNQGSDITSKDLAENASKKFEIFHIMIGQDSKNFQNIIPGRIIYVNKTDINYLPEIIISAIQIVKGQNKKDVLKQWGVQSRVIVENALSLLVLSSDDKINL